MEGECDQAVNEGMDKQMESGNGQAAREAVDLQDQVLQTVQSHEILENGGVTKKPETPPSRPKGMRHRAKTEDGVRDKDDRIRKRRANEAEMEEIMNDLRAEVVGSGGQEKKRRLQESEENEKEALVAVSLGFPRDCLTEEEIDAGVVTNLGGVDQGNYIAVRNHILAKWRHDVSSWLDESSIMDRIRNTHRTHVTTAYRFLSQYGYINFGVSAAVRNHMPVDPPPDAPTVIIIGAGLAGLAAARQLLSFNYRVVVLEARERPGGRVYTKQMKAGNDGPMAHADLGGSVLTGIFGNPLGVIVRQLGLPLHHIRDVCPLYQPDGRAVHPEIDDRMTTRYNKLLDRANKWREDMEVVSDKISLGTTMETFHEDWRAEAPAQENQLWDWHLANLEYANAALLKDLSLAYWDQDDPYEMVGDHCFLAGGNIQIVDALCDGVPIHYNLIVQKVCYGEKGVEVTAHNKSKDGAVEKFEGDMVLCTLPLGVLKRASVQFEPQLPEKKVDAIRRLGFGLLNKVALLFSHAFWGDELDTFGRLSETSEMRGEFFLFYSYTAVSGGAVLMALVAGEAAVHFESTSASTIVDRVMKVLRGIYDPKGIRVPAPLQTVCTRWGGDQYATGSYSYVAVGSSGDDYDILAEPVGDGRLFFAGEATIRRYPATMHGAFLSGMREAGNIAAAVSQRRAPSLAEEAALSAGAKKHLVPNSLQAYVLALEEMFRHPDVEFGIFDAVWDPRPEAGHDAPAILRVTFRVHLREGFGNVPSPHPQVLHLYSMVPREHVMALREVKGDQNRLIHLEEIGVKLVGRRGLGSQGDSLIAHLRSAHASRSIKKLTVR